MKHGKGVLKFQNNYKFEGEFKEDEINTKETIGVLIDKTANDIEEGEFVKSNDPHIGFLQTLNSIYVFDFKEGIVRKTIR